MHLLLTTLQKSNHLLQAHQLHHLLPHSPSLQKWPTLIDLPHSCCTPESQGAPPLILSSPQDTGSATHQLALPHHHHPPAAFLYQSLTGSPLQPQHTSSPNFSPQSPHLHAHHPLQRAIATPIISGFHTQVRYHHNLLRPPHHL